MTDIVDHYLREMVLSIHKVEQSETTYHTVAGAYADKYGPGTTADFQAASDPRLQAAISDGAFHRSRATMYACAATAAMLDQQRARS